MDFRQIKETFDIELRLCEIQSDIEFNSVRIVQPVWALLLSVIEPHSMEEE